VEASALTRTNVSGLRGPSPMLRLQSDERLIALTRRGQHAAFETLCSRYQSRLLSFCRHMLGSREDAEDVLQEVFAAAFNAVLADEREINVRPWLYRIARNRSLNHLRRASAVGVDSMDVHFADHGISTGDRVIRRESFRELLADVQQLPETQHTALLLREIDALSYEQIAHAMETTVPSVKSLLVRARVSLAEAAEARALGCAEVRLELGEVAEGLTKLSAPARRHVRGCERCRFFKKQLKDNNHALAAIFPVGPLLLAKKLLLTKLGSTASAGGAHVAGGAGATVGAGAGAGAAAGAGATGGASVAGGIFTAGAGAVATKAVAGLAAAAMVTAGAVAADHAASQPGQTSHRVTNYAPVVRHAREPIVLNERSQPLSPGVQKPAASTSAKDRSRHHQLLVPAKIASATPTAVAASAAPPVPATVTAAVVSSPATPGDARPAPPQVTEVTTQTTQLSSAASGAGQSTSQAAPPAPPTSPSSTGPAPTPPTSTEAPASPANTEPAHTSTGGTEAPPVSPSIEAAQSAGSSGQASAGPANAG